MCCNKFFVFVLVLIFFKSNAVSGQALPGSIDEIFDLLGISPLDLINVLDSTNLEEICEDIRNLQSNDTCTTQLKIICDNEPFMSRMLDASSKYPYSGMLVKTRLDFGTYDECIDLDLTQNGVRVIGKHCTGGLIIPTTELNDTDFFDKAFKLSTCIPDGCSANELMTILNVSSDLPFINDISCSTKESWKTLGTDDCIAIAGLLVFVTVMVVSTIYDVYLYYANKECPHILLKAFSVYYNGKKLLQVSKGPSDQIKVIHGLRVISMMWIVGGHSFGTMASYPGININFPMDFEWSRKSWYITPAHIAVDTFFFISGLLLAYQYLKQDPKPLKTQIKQIPYLYLHRYLRLTPAVAAAFIFTITLLSHIGNGPIYYDAIQIEKETCLKYWWSFFLYIQNYFNYDEICIISTWYLSADWQLFLISPIVIIPVAILVKRNFRLVIGLLLLLNIFVTIAPLGLQFLFNYFDNDYETHPYLNTYFIGVMMGVFMREKSNRKYPFTTAWNFIIWVMVLLMMLLTILVYKEIDLLRPIHGPSIRTYFILVRVFWCAGLSWIIYSCHNGYGGIINWLLTTPLVQVLSKLTFCLYITHLGPIIYFRLTTRVPVVFSQMTAIKDTVLAYFSSLVLSVFWTMAFESPLITLEKYFMGIKK